jgi:hypothetical protein
MKVTMFFTFLIMFSCSSKKAKMNLEDESIKELTKYEELEVDSSFVDSIFNYTEQDSLWELKSIRLAWSELDSILDLKYYIKFENGILIYFNENEIICKSNYKLEKTEYNGVGNYLLNIDCESFHSISFNENSVEIYEDSEDGNSFVFVRASPTAVRFNPLLPHDCIVCVS